jgi:hypothetical protein
VTSRILGLWRLLTRAAPPSNIAAAPIPTIHLLRFFILKRIVLTLKGFDEVSNKGDYRRHSDHDHRDLEFAQSEIEEGLQV